MNFKNILLSLFFIVTSFVTTAQVSDTERQALIAIYNATDGDNWESTIAGSQPWLVNDPTSLVEDWSGVTVEEGKVVGLGLYTLSGTLPSDIGNLSSLRKLQLYRNPNLVGSIPLEIFSLISLESLQIEQCGFTGNIPPEIENLTNLQSLNISTSQFTGSIPAEISKLSTLKWFYCNNNNSLSGSIPPEIGNLSSLIQLSISHNNGLSGSIPPEIGNLLSLSYLRMEGNENLSGIIPSELGNITNLGSIILTANNLQGSIPSEIDDLPNLGELSVSGNNLTGEIPPLDILVSKADLGVFLQLQNNSFVFSDFEAQQQNFDDIYYYSYSPQANVDQEENLSVIEGESITLTSVALTSTNNIYQWYKDGVAIGTPTTTKELVIENATEADAGEYYFTATNSIVTDLTLTRNIITLQVSEAVDTCGVSAEERAALVALYESTDGDNWTNTWDLSLTPCDWYGVTVISGNITRLDLSNNDMDGEIPSELGNLISLEFISFQNNNLIGAIPSTFGALSSLSSVNLAGNGLTGEIPSELGDLIMLRFFSLSDNSLTGEIPSELGNLTSVYLFTLNDNNLSGAIPSELSNLKLLRFFGLGGNNLSGEIPIELMEISTIEQKRFNDNQFVFLDFEKVHENFSNLISNISFYIFSPQAKVDQTETLSVAEGETITLTSTALTSTNNTYQWYRDGVAIGTPSTTKELVIENATEADAGEYYFTATNSIVTDLTLTRNTITLDVNEVVDNCGVSEEEKSALWALYQSTDGDNWTNTLADNKPWSLDTSICDWYGVSVYDGDISTLRLADNNLSGTIPSDLENLNGLQQIYFESNNLVGEIPTEIGNIISLIIINLSNNNLSGNIPPSFSQLINSPYFDVSNNNLSGLIPTFINAEAGILFANNNFVFSDFEDDHEYNAGIEYYEFSPQANVDEVESLTVTENGSITLTSNDLTSANNIYQWYKNDEPIGNPTNNKELVIENAKVTDSGDYYFTATNSIVLNTEYDDSFTIVQELTLTRNPITLTVEESTNTDCVSAEEKAALWALYESTDGDNWTNTLAGDKPWSLDTSVCDWYGVTVVDGNVIELLLFNNGLRGYISSEIENLPNLVNLTLRSNVGLSGTGIQPAITNLKNLRTLDLRNSNLGGEIPSNIGNISTLYQLHLDGNQLTGIIPNSIGDLKVLSNLYIKNNQLEGAIPPEIGDLELLVNLDLSSNNLLGNIPADLGELKNIASIYFDSNNFVFDDFDTSFFNITTFGYSSQSDLEPSPDQELSEGEPLIIKGHDRLQHIDNKYQWYKSSDNGVTYTLIEGATIKDYEVDAASIMDIGMYKLEITNVTFPELTLTQNPTKITVVCDIPPSEKQALLDLYSSTNGDNWTNTIAGDHVWNDDTSVCDWYGVTVVDGHVSKVELNENELTGSLNPSLNDLPYLLELNLSDNQISGEILSEYSGLINLQGFYISNNNLTGEIPVSIGSLLNIQHLYLDGNELTGEILPTICTLTKLTDFSLANNQITGSIITRFSALNDIEHIDLANNMLSGAVSSVITTLEDLDYLDISNNSFTGSLPNLTNLSELETLLINDNAFTFSDFEDQHLHYLENVDNYVFAPQGDVDEELEITLTEGDEFIVNTSLSSENNTYLWFKDGNAIGGITNEYKIDEVSLNDAGEYFFEARNSIVIDLVLKRKKVTLTVLPGCEVNDEEKQTLLELYTATNGTNWGNTVSGTQVWDSETSVCTDWYGVTVVDNKVTEINLSDNGLLGDLSAIDFSVFTALEKVDISISSFLFHQIEEAYETLGDKLIYNPQADFGTEQTQTVVLGDPLSLDDGGVLQSDSNQYQWYKDGVEIESRTSKNLNIATLAAEDVGTYVLKVTNTKVPNLILSQEPLNVVVTGGVCTVSEIEKQALIDFYNATGGENWTNSTNWLSDTPVSDWFGVTVQGCNITGLSLTNNGLIGELDGIGNLVNLQELNLGYNDIEGVISSSITSLSELKILSLTSNQLGGFIPNDIGNLINLEELYLGYNGNIEGNIPSSITNLTKLRILALNSNKLSGFIPNDIANLSNLENLELFGNQLEGEIPSTITELSKLKYIKLFSNELEGVVPQGIGNLINLIELQLGNNNITGTIPEGLTSLTNLIRFNIYNNDISGEIPSNIGNLTLMKELVLASNTLSGDLPDSISQLNNLTNLNIQSNNLSGKLPNELISFSGLTHIYINNNNFVFSDFETEHQYYLDNISSYSYNPQAKVEETKTISVLHGQNYTLLGGDELTSENNSYQWFKDGELIEGANSKDYVIENMSIDDAGTYHFEATNSIVVGLTIERNPITVIDKPTSCSISDDQRQALIDFYYATDGANWENTLTGEMVWEVTNPDADVCNWYGVAVGDNFQVIELQLAGNTLRGEIPETISGLTGLVKLNLSENLISGVIPESIGSFFYLEDLNLSNNNMVSVIPTTITNLPSIQSINLSNNYFIETIPDEIGNLVGLKVLDLGNNKLKGNLPESIYDLENLTDLKLNDNSFSGSLSDSISNFQSLENLWLSNNNFSGVIPQQLETIPSLVTVHIENNGFYGDLPVLIPNVNIAGTSVKIDGNAFIFNDFETEFDYYNDNVWVFSYSPQAFVDSTEYIKVNLGDVITLTSNELVSENNSYQWFKYDNTTNNWDQIIDATSKEYELTINSLETDLGNYRFESTNSIVDDLVLTRHTINVSEIDTDGDGIVDSEDPDPNDPDNPNGGDGGTDPNDGTDPGSNLCEAFPYVNLEQVPLPDGATSVKWFEFDYTDEDAQVFYPDSFTIEEIIAYNSGEENLFFTNEGTLDIDEEMLNLFELSPEDTEVYPGMELWAQIDGDITVLTKITLDPLDPNGLPVLPSDGDTVEPDYTQYFPTSPAPTVTDLVSLSANTTWHGTLESTEELNPSTRLSESDDYFAAIDGGFCRIRVFVEIGAKNVEADGYQEFCSIDSPKISDLDIAHQDGTTLIYYASESGTTTYSANDMLQDNTTYYVTEHDGYSESEERKAIYVEINNATAPTVSSSSIVIYIAEGEENAYVDQLYADGQNIQWYISSTSESPLIPSDTLIDGHTYYASQQISGGCEGSHRVALTVTLQEDPGPEFTLCEKFRPNPGDEYVVSGWVRQQGVREKSSETKKINEDPVAGPLLPELVNYLLNRFVFAQSDETKGFALLRFVPELHIPVSEEDARKYDPLRDYLIETPSDNLTVYDFEYVKETRNGYERTIGFQFSFAPDKVAPDFKYITPEYNSSGAHYPLLNNQDFLTLNFTGYDEAALSAGELKLKADFEIVDSFTRTGSATLQNKQISQTMDYAINNVLVEKTFVEYEPDPNYKVADYIDSLIEVVYYADDQYTILEDSGTATFKTSGTIIDGWQRISASFRVPNDAYIMSINLKNSSTEAVNSYFDDIRVHPYNSNLKSFVYDPITQRLQAELDENNYATFYEYDKEGGLIRVKKETERGVYTIQETRSGNSKYSSTK